MELGKDNLNTLLALSLGDGHISRPIGNGNCRIRLEHTEQQRDYLEWKINMVPTVFRPIKMRTKDYMYKGVTKSLVSYHVYSRSLPQITLLRRLLYHSGSKVITPKILEKVGLLGLLILYMDDGYLGDRAKSSRGYTLRIYTFMSQEENQAIIDYLFERYGVKFYQARRSKGIKGFILECGTKQARAFLSLFDGLEKPECMSYKFDIT